MHPGRRLCAALAAVFLVLLTAPGTAHAAAPARNGRIAFTANLHGSWQLFTMTPAGNGLRQVTHIPRSTDIDLFQDWSPDGRRLAYSSSASGSSDLYVVDADGSGTRRVTSGAGDDLAPAWSPDGTRLAFARVTNDQTAAIYTVKLDGTGLQRLTSPAYDSFFPRYTPDGRHLVFESSRGGLTAAVWIMSADGSGARRLTSAGFRGTPWDVSPDGTRILIGDNQNSALPTSLHDIKLDGTGLRRLTRAGCCYHDGNASYSPDGRSIAFVTDRTFAPRGLREDEIWLMTADGRDPHPVTSSLTLGGCPDELVGNCVGSADWGRQP